MLWVWGEPPGVKILRTHDLAVVAKAFRLRRAGRPKKHVAGKEAIAAYRTHLEKAAARTKKWREKKGESSG